MRITSKGQVTIPQEIREALGLLPHTQVEFIRDKDGVRIVVAKDKSQGSRGSSIVNRLRGRSKTGLSTEEIMKMTRSDK